MVLSNAVKKACPVLITPLSRTVSGRFRVCAKVDDKLPKILLAPLTLSSRWINWICLLALSINGRSNELLLPAISLTKSCTAIVALLDTVSP